MNEEKKSEEIWKRVEQDGLIGIEEEPTESPCRNCKSHKLYGNDCWYFWHGKISCSMREEDIDERNKLEEKAD